jgi:hypothetical protein
MAKDKKNPNDGTSSPEGTHLHLTTLLYAFLMDSGPPSLLHNVRREEERSEG